MEKRIEIEGGVILNWLKAQDKYELRGRTVYCGPAPFDIDKRDPTFMEALLKRPWVISYPGAEDMLFWAKGIESWCISFISQGTPIGVLVEPV